MRLHALERARRELDRCTIASPTDGIVISRAVDVGQTVAASLSAPVLCEIAADLARMQIHANVAESDIGNVKEGHSVRFRVNAYRDRECGGNVVQVRNAPLVADNVVHYETIIEVDNSEGHLKPGMTAEVSIITDERFNVLRVRNIALRARLPDAIVSAGPWVGEGEGRDYLVRPALFSTEAMVAAVSVSAAVGLFFLASIRRGKPPASTPSWRSGGSSMFFPFGFDLPGALHHLLFLDPASGHSATF